MVHDEIVSLCCRTPSAKPAIPVLRLLLVDAGGRTVLPVSYASAVGVECAYMDHGLCCCDLGGILGDHSGPLDAEVRVPSLWNVNVP